MDENISNCNSRLRDSAQGDENQSPKSGDSSEANAEEIPCKRESAVNRKQRRNQKRKRKWKPYNELTWDEKRVKDDRESRKAFAKRERLSAEGHPIAPYNTTQFLMDDRKSLISSSSPSTLAQPDEGRYTHTQNDNDDNDNLSLNYQSQCVNNTITCNCTSCTNSNSENSAIHTERCGYQLSEASETKSLELPQIPGKNKNENDLNDNMNMSCVVKPANAKNIDQHTSNTKPDIALCGKVNSVVAVNQDSHKSNDWQNEVNAGKSNKEQNSTSCAVPSSAKQNSCARDHHDHSSSVPNSKPGGINNQGEDIQNYIMDDFSHTYADIHVEHLQSMSKAELIEECLKLEKKVSFCQFYYYKNCF